MIFLGRRKKHKNNELTTIALMDKFMIDNGYELDYDGRYHHEIYLSNLQKCDANKLKTVIRHPIKKKIQN